MNRIELQMNIIKKNQKLQLIFLEKDLVLKFQKRIRIKPLVRWNKRTRLRIIKYMNLLIQIYNKLKVRINLKMKRSKKKKIRLKMKSLIKLVIHLKMNKPKIKKYN